MIYSTKRKIGMINSTERHISWGVLGAVVTCLFGVSLASAQEERSRGFTLEEIIVTAQHKEENIQDIPVSVTAIGSDAIAKADIFDATGIALHTPGLSFSEFAPGQAIPALRGISSADDGAGLDNSVALFLDGVYIGRAQVGEITSSMRSPVLGKNIALARVDVAHYQVGTIVEIGKLDGHIKRLPAKIVPFAHYDPTKSKPRS